MSNDLNREELEKLAQGKLVEARRLIREAGDLAKEGQFYLSFGEIGEFIPKTIFDRTAYRVEAEAELKRDGRDNGHDKVPPTTEKPYGDWAERPRTPYAELTEEERETAIDDIIEGILENLEVSWEFREYHSEGTDKWWHPSRC